MRHDPERAAAAYLAGQLDSRGRSRFERHLLDCEDCWRETNAARTGRMLAESLRETAPAPLRERIRAVAALPPPDLPRARPRRSPVRWPYPFAAAATAMLVLIVVLLPDDTRTQPAALVEAATMYRTGGPQQVSPDHEADQEPPVRRIADYHWQSTTHGELAGIPTTIHTYAAPSGRRLLVLSSTERFPRAVDARVVAPAPSWIAAIDGTTMLCADEPGTSWLAIAATSGDALTAGRALGLTTT